MSIILNPGQEAAKNAAVYWYNHSSEQLFQIDGLAGTGKTVVIHAILEAINISPAEYYAMAYTGQASIVMRTRGFTTAKSIHSTLYEVVEVLDRDNISEAFGVPKKRREFRKRSFIDPNIKLFIIDEAYMVPDYMVKDIMSFGVKVIVCGDAHQLPPVGGNPGFLINGTIHHLTQLMRQAADNPLLYLADRAMKGLPIHNGVYGNNQVLVINDDEFVPQMIGYADYILCGTNRTRELMNSYVRSLAGFVGSLPHYGEKVICRNNNWDIVSEGIALANGLRGTVVSEPDASSFYDRQAFMINFKPDLVDTVFYNAEVNFKYFAANFDEKSAIKSSPEREWLVGNMFDYAYALTTHLAQGSEVNRGIYIEEFMRPQLMKQLNYTAITRFRQGMIYIKKKNKYFYIPN